MPPNDLNTSTCPPAAVSVLGLGLMGSALARAFLSHSHKVTVWNRSPAKAAPLAAAGAAVANTPAQCINSSSLIVICITDSDALRDTMTHLPPSLGKDRILVDFTTGCPSQINHSAKMVRDLGFSTYIHGAILAFPAQVGRKEAFLYYSGGHNAYIFAEPTLTALGTPVYLDEEPSSAALQEVIIVSSMYSWWAGFLQSMALLKTTKLYQSGGMSASRMLKEILAPLYTHSMEVFEAMCQEMDTGEYQTKGDGARLVLHLSSLRNFSRTLIDQGISDVILRPIIGLVEDRIAEGGENEELSALVEVMSISGSKSQKLSSKLA